MIFNAINLKFGPPNPRMALPEHDFLIRTCWKTHSNIFNSILSFSPQNSNLTHIYSKHSSWAKPHQRKNLEMCQDLAGIYFFSDFSWDFPVRPQYDLSGRISNFCWWLRMPESDWICRSEFSVSQVILWLMGENLYSTGILIVQWSGVNSHQIR